MGASPQGNQNSLQVQAAPNDHVTVNPSAIRYGEVREDLFKMSEAITTQAQPILNKAYWEVFPKENQHASTMARCFRDFTRVDPSKHFGSNEELQYILDEFYKILFAMGVITMEKADLVAYKHKDVARTWFNLWKDSWFLEIVP